jgi:hypothetical protein
MINEKILVFLITNGIVITQLKPDELKGLHKVTTLNISRQGRGQLKNGQKFQ